MQQRAVVAAVPFIILCLGDRRLREREILQITFESIKISLTLDVPQIVRYYESQRKTFLHRTGRDTSTNQTVGFVISYEKMM